MYKWYKDSARCYLYLSDVVRQFEGGNPFRKEIPIYRIHFLVGSLGVGLCKSCSLRLNFSYGMRTGTQLGRNKVTLTQFRLSLILTLLP